MRQLTCAAALAGIAALTAVAEAGSTTSRFSVSAEVVRSCVLDRGGVKGPEVTCVKGTPAPRIGRRPVAVVFPAAAPTPQVVESAAPDGASVRVNVDF